MRSDAEVSAEYSAIRGLIEDPTLIPTSQLSSDSFSSSERSMVFDALYALSTKGLRVDELTVLDRCPRQFHEECKLVITDALCGPGVPKNYPAYEAIVLRAAEHDRIRHLARMLEDDPDKIDTILSELTGTTRRSRWESDSNQAAIKAFELLERMQSGIAGVTTSIPQLDEKIQKMVPGRLTVIGARPSMGKTALATTIAVFCGEPVGIISSEMSTDQITLRIISMLSSVPLTIAQKGMDHDMWERWNKGVSALKKTPLYINDKPAITADEIFKQSRKWVYNNGVKLIVVDYLQRLGGDPRKDRTTNIRDNISACKEIARTLDVHVIALSQVNRDIERREDKRPMMSDYDGAGTIEAEADHVVSVYRPWVYDKSADKRAAELIVVKNRHGEIGVVHSVFEPVIVTFKPSTRKEMPF